MFNIVLYQPEIPPNTGNIMRLCVNVGCKLHLIKPLGFDLSEKNLKRANLDYKLAVPPMLYDNFAEYQSKNMDSRIFLCSTKATTTYSDIQFQPGDSFVFGPETRGLPLDILNLFPNEKKIIIPMQPNARSLNLANSVAVIVYEAWRQHNFI